MLRFHLAGRPFRTSFAMAAALVVLATIPLSAQVVESHVRVGDIAAGGIACSDVDGPAWSYSFSSCSHALAGGGLGYGSSLSEGWGSNGYVWQYGHLNAYANGHGPATFSTDSWAMQWRSITTSGNPSSSPVSLLFHFAANVGLGANAPASGLSYAAVGLELLGGQSSSTNSYFYRTVHPGGSLTFDYTPNASGFNFVLPYDPNDGVFSYRAKAAASVYAEGLGSYSDYASIDAYLSSVEALDAQGNNVGNVTLDYDGNDVLLFAVAAPEPGTFVLFATGLVGVLARRRRRNGRLFRRTQRG